MQWLLTGREQNGVLFPGRPDNRLFDVGPFSSKKIRVLVRRMGLLAVSTLAGSQAAPPVFLSMVHTKYPGGRYRGFQRTVGLYSTVFFSSALPDGITKVGRIL